MSAILIHVHLKLSKVNISIFKKIYILPQLKQPSVIFLYWIIITCVFRSCRNCLSCEATNSPLHWLWLATQTWVCIFCCSTPNKRICVQAFCPLTIGALTLVLCVSVNIHFYSLPKPDIFSFWLFFPCRPHNVIHSDAIT